MDNQILDNSNANNKLDLLYSYSDYIPHNCTFNLKGEFILYTEADVDTNNYDKKIVWIYSTQLENNKWKCKRIYKLPEDFKLIGISKYDKLYLFSNHRFYEWNMLTEKSIRILTNKNEKDEHFERYHLRRKHHELHTKKKEHDHDQK